MTDPKPNSDSATALRAQVTSARWERIEQEARMRARVYETVVACHDETELLPAPQNRLILVKSAVVAIFLPCSTSLSGQVASTA